MERRKVRYAVVGAGNIAQVAVLPAFAHAKENSQLVAIVSGDPEKRAELQKRYRLEHVGGYDEFESILERGQIDAVYIANPNTEHKEFVLRAAQQQVHVLCEKPLAPTVADCEEMLSACSKNGVKLMVAYRLHFEGANLRALELVQSGELGSPQIFSSFFTHVVKEGDIRRRADLAGGATYDLGVYCINAARTLFGAEPVTVFAKAVERDGTDDTMTALLYFPDDRLAEFTVSNSVAGVSEYRIAGAKGSLRLEPAFEHAEGNDLYLTIDDKTKHESFPKRDQFAAELVYFSNCILHDLEPEPSGEEGLYDVRVIEAILESARVGRSVELAPLQRDRRPTPAQEMHKPPISKPDTVNAPSPSEG
ncbi:MAG TPA: Gfo/Idh/MocA family oxidoreductase [Polyangiaceae bacterium]|nr:Gfo/Idh/MocA family oxidoreductase [Polyangiaceae bacterium]